MDSKTIEKQDTVYLSEDDYLTLVENGTITKGGYTLTYDKGNNYKIPAKEVNNATVTIKQGSETKGTFTLNQSGDVVITLDSGNGVADVQKNDVSLVQNNIADLSNFVENTDYATENAGGVIKGNKNGFIVGTSGTVSEGNPSANTYTYTQYQNTMTSGYFIGKGTLENVITGKGLLGSSDKATTISDTPSDSKVTTESAIYNYVASGNSGKTRTLDGVDLNTVTATGFYSCNVCTNRPTANNGVMLVLKNGFASDNLVQVYWTFTADVMWVRHKDLGNWKSWESIVKNSQLADYVQTSNIVNNVTSTDTNKPLSANMGKELQDQITYLKARGRYLSVWNCTTGLAETTPVSPLPYTYSAGDYFIVGTVGTTNYIPTGSSYTGTASTTTSSATINVNDTFYYDGSQWTLLSSGGQVSLTWGSISGTLSNQTDLNNALNSKVDKTSAETISGVKTFSNGLETTDIEVSGDITDGTNTITVENIYNAITIRRHS